MTRWPCALFLENGHFFQGWGYGAPSSDGGEVVFNTGMAGYQEIFTDPSYSNQIVVMGYPHIGNYGINRKDVESKSIFLHGIAVRELCEAPSSWRSEMTLDEYMAQANIPIISDVDTREITTLLRNEGAQRGVIFPLGKRSQKEAIEHAKRLVQEIPSMEGLELVSQVSCKEPYEYIEGTEPGDDSSLRTVVVYDFGVKTNILRHLKRRQFRVKVVPYNTPHQDVLAENPQAVLLSNGPGDPGTVKGAVEEIQALIGKIPIFAICMGHQLLARALGAKTYKLKFGHHGVNQPVKDTLLGRIIITSQNHGFAVPEEALEQEDIKITHVNLNDHTVEGFYSEKMQLMSLQFHPEAAPGPSDASYLFDSFVKRFLR